MERDLRPADAAGGNRGEQFVREVQAGCRRGRRPRLSGEDGLVAGEVPLPLFAAADVSGQWHAAHAIEDSLGRPASFRPHDPRAASAAADEFERLCLPPLAIDEHDPLADLRPATGLRQDPPPAGPGLLLQKEPFPLAAGGGAAADEPRGHDAGVVDDDEIAGREELGQVADVAVVDRAVGAAEHEQPGVGSALQRLLCDQLFGEVVVVKVGVGHKVFHGIAKSRLREVRRPAWYNGGMSSSVHTSVLPAEVMSFLAVKPGMRVVDGTLGGGGHTRLLAEAVGPEGLVIAVDRDPVAIDRGARELAGLPVRFAQANFRDIPEVLDAVGLDAVDAVLLDVGLSSDQLSDESRGFSFDSDGPLDLRFDPTEGEPAWRMVNRMKPESLADIIFEYGEERFSRRIARRIATVREKQPIRTAREFARIVTSAIPKQHPPPRIHPATRTFQALRIAVNEELKSLRISLERIPTRLVPGGRLAVISFHSLEDRLVKQAFRNAQVWECITRSPIEASNDEILRNPRSRSAKLRAAARLPSPG